jgi:putative endonuclease
MFYVYILRSKTYNRYYTGFTSNCEKRLEEHNSGKVRATKHFIPWEIVHTEEYENKSDAVAREKQIKSYRSSEAFKKLINKPERWQSG